jgi:hypothetical protein
MWEWRVIYQNFPFWHIHKETLQKHAYQHFHIFLSTCSNLKTTERNFMKFDFQEFYLNLSGYSSFYSNWTTTTFTWHVHLHAMLCITR